MTSQCRASASSCFQPWISRLVPGVEKWLLKKSSMSSSRCEPVGRGVGRRTAIEPPWLTRVECPLHMVGANCAVALEWLSLESSVGVSSEIG